MSGTGPDRNTLRRAAGRDYPRRTALWVAATTALLAGAALVAGITTPPRSGALCRAECVTYPYTDVVAFVPRDYWWMYPGLLVALTAVLHEQPGASDSAERASHRRAADSTTAGTT